MPPMVKKPGRPLGSKNKNKSKKIKKAFKKKPIIKKEKTNVINISYENDSSNDPFSKKVIFHCKKCPNKNFKFEENYNEHILLEHSTLPGSVPCKSCHVVCPDQKTLDIHVGKIHERDVYKCAYCEKEFVRQAHVLRHMAQKGCDGSEVASFPCEICDATFTRKDNLIVHLRQMHIKKTFFQCKQTKCDFQSKNLTKLIRHWHSVHAETPNQFDCDICGKSTMSRAAMTKHLEIHGDKKYACDVCGYSTYTIEVMRRHILTHVEDKPYKCDQCNSSYIQRAQLERHLEKHLVNKCPVCGIEFSCKIRFMLHHNRHKGPVKLVCTYKDCDYTKEFSSEAKLVAHMNTHMETKIYSCEVCNKPFNSEVNMRRHLNTHTLDRPRRCMYCVSARAYVRGQQLVRHVRKFHREVFAAHLCHVRAVLNSKTSKDRVSQSEMESILNVLDAEAERILEGYGHRNVLYGGMQVQTDLVSVDNDAVSNHDEEEEDNPLMSEEVLADSLTKLLMHLIDEDTLQCLGWPEESIDVILEKVIEQCGAKPADRDMWSRVQRLRENAKHLFLYVVDDKSVSRMLGTHTIDQIVKHLLVQATGPVIARTDCKPNLMEL